MGPFTLDGKWRIKTRAISAEPRSEVTWAEDNVWNSLLKWYRRQKPPHEMTKRQKPGSDLAWSILNNNLDAVRAQLAAGLDPNKADKDGWTPLIAAAGAGFLPIVQLLIERGADVNHPDVGGFTPLMCAAGAGHVDIVRFLISKGAQVDRTDDSSRTALSWAMTKKDVVEVVRALFDFRANPNHSDDTGMTPLMRAALLKFPHSFDALVKAGANPFVKHVPSEKTAIDMAAESDNSALIDAARKLKSASQNR